MEATGLCQYLEWDSDFFGRRIARINANLLDHEIISSAMKWCDLNDIDCLYFLGSAADDCTVRLAEDNGFHFVDIRITYERRLDGNLASENKGLEGIRLCTPNDIPALKAIAGLSHRDTRFYYDPNFLSFSRDALYQTWIEKSCHGYADAVLVAEFEGQLVGYISCHLQDQNKGNIGLVGVRADTQGRGVGRRLINESLRSFASHRVNHVTVVTQGRNQVAQRLYQRCGFLTRSVQLWYHRWFSRGTKS